MATIPQTSDRDRVIEGMRELLRRLVAEETTPEEELLIDRLCDFHAGFKAGRRREQTQAQAGALTMALPAVNNALTVLVACAAEAAVKGGRRKVEFPVTADGRDATVTVEFEQLEADNVPR